MRWLSELHEKLEKVPAKYLILDGTINPGERVIGTLPEDLLRLYGLHLQMMEETQNALEEHLRSHFADRVTEAGCKKFHETLAWRVQQTQTVERLFWTAARMEFNVPGGHIGIRAHGTVVTYEHSPDDELTDAELAVMLEQMKCGGKPN